MIVYIAGPMTGQKDYNREAFEQAERELCREGHIALNPGKLPLGMPDYSYMPICMAMLEQAEAIYLLKGWEHSKGAIAEFCYAVSQNKAIEYE